MDRMIDRRSRRNALAKRGLLVAVILVAASAIYVWASDWIQPSIERSSIRTATVDSGPIEATISASGTVVPEFEGVLASPLDARVLKILKRPGASVKAGDPIVALDVSESDLDLQRAREKTQLKENEQEQKRLELESKMVDLRRQLELKQVDVKSLAITLDKQRALREGGLVSSEQVRAAQVDLEKAQIEVRQLHESIASAERSTKAQIEGLRLELGTLKQQLAQSERERELATTKSDRDGVLTWVVADEGSVVHKNDVIARVADLRSFRVQATISDIHASRLTTGLPAHVQANDSVMLDGTVASILPTIKDGVVTLLIDLAEKSNKLLRSNLRVDVYIVAGHRANAVRVARGAFANGEGMHDVFIVRGKRGVRTAANLGMFGIERCEVLSGLSPGDEVITSDMKEYAHLKSVQLK